MIPPLLITKSHLSYSNKLELADKEYLIPNLLNIFVYIHISKYLKRN